MKKIILLAEDERNARFSLVILLMSFFKGKIKVKAVANGKEALKKIKDGLRPDILITDYEMPELDGVGLIDEILKDPNLKILKLLMSANNNGRDGEPLTIKAKKQDFFFFSKPINEDELCDILKPIIETK